MKVAIVGCGNAAHLIDDKPHRRIYSHAKAISQIPELEIVACCDIDVPKGNEFAERWNVPHCYVSLDSMLECEKIDILVIATPTSCHISNIYSGLNSDVKAIFCEKPLTFSFLQGKKLLAESKKLIVINYTRRWDSFFRECKGILDRGEIGQVETIIAYTDTAWYMNASHMLDLMAWYAGPVDSCHSYVDKTKVRLVHGTPDYGGVATFKHKNGIVSFVSALVDTEKNHRFELDIMGSEGRFKILNDLMYNLKKGKEYSGTEPNSHEDERLVNAYKDIIECVKTGKKPIYTAEESLESIRMVEMINGYQ